MRGSSLACSAAGMRRDSSERIREGDGALIADDAESCSDADAEECVDANGRICWEGLRDDAALVGSGMGRMSETAVKAVSRPDI